VYTPRDLRSSDPRGSPPPRLVAQPSMISGTAVLTQLPGRGVTTGLKEMEKKKEKETRATLDVPPSPGFTV